MGLVLAQLLPYVYASMQLLPDVCMCTCILYACTCTMQVYFGTQHSRVYILASIKGENCANGMSWLVRKQAIEREGGLLAFSEYLAEDFFMGKALWNKYRVMHVMSEAPDDDYCIVGKLSREKPLVGMCCIQN